MPSQLPPGPVQKRRRVLDFGIGPYDRSLDGVSEEEMEAGGESLPGGGGSSPVPPNIIGYPTTPAAVDVASLPGDVDRPYRGHHPEEDVVTHRVPSVAESRVPYDRGNPPARSDYYDRTTVGESQLPSVSKNDVSMDDFLGALGNMWSGFVEEDLSNPAGFPTRNFREDPESLDGGVVPEGFIASSNRRPTMGVRHATNINLVTTITDDFLKKYGKKGLTRRHVMAFLNDSGYHQYLASDVVRCLAEKHEIYIADVLDEFPLKELDKSESKAASLVNDVKSIRDRIVRARPINRDASAKIGRIASDLTTIIADLERLGDGKEG
jgi:hypothetical protein